MIQPDYRLRVIGHETIRPYDPALINPASIDLRLGNIIRQPHWYWRNPVTVMDKAIAERLEKLEKEGEDHG